MPDASDWMPRNDVNRCAGCPELWREVVAMAELARQLASFERSGEKRDAQGSKREGGHLSAS